MSLKIYINEILIDTYPKEVVAITFQTNELSEVRDRQASYSNTFKVPRTRNNRRIFGNADLVTTASKVPYTYLAARIIQNGVNIIQDAIAEVTRVEEDFEITLFDRVLSFWSSIDGLSCHDAYEESLFDPIRVQYQHLRSARQARIYNMNPDSKVVYPIIEYQRTPPTTTNTSFQMDVQYFFPAVYIKDIVAQIFAHAGYVLETDLFLDPVFNSLIIPYSDDAEEDTFSIENMVPDMSQKDFLKAIAFMFGVNFIQKRFSRNVILTEPFDQPLFNEPYNWSDKIDFSKEPVIERKWGEWGILNRFAYTEDDVYMFEASVELEFGNLTAKQKYEAITLPFAVSLNQPSFQGQTLPVGKINLIHELDETGAITDSESRTLRIMQLERVQSPITYIDRFDALTQTGGVPYAYFPLELTINYILENKYKMLRRIFSQPMKLTCHLNLTTVDIEALDLSRPVYLSKKHINGYFLISKVNEYKKGYTTEVELVRISSEAPVPLVSESGFLIDSENNYAIDNNSGRVYST